MQCLNQILSIFAPRPQLQLPVSTADRLRANQQATQARLPMAPLTTIQGAPTPTDEKVSPQFQPIRRCRSLDAVLDAKKIAGCETMILASSTPSNNKPHILHGRFWSASLLANNGQPQGVVTIIHGMGEHSGSYQALAQHLCDEGYHVIAFDHRGHGLTQGKRGVLESYSQLHGDVRDHVAYSKTLFPNLPHCVYGHSMGGGLLLDHLNQFHDQDHLHHIEKFIVSSPWIKLKNPLAPLIDIVAWILKQLNANIVHEIGRNIPENPDREPMEDPLSHSRISTNWFREAQNSGVRTLQTAAHFPVAIRDKLVLFHSNNDLVTEPKATAKFAKESNVAFIQTQDLSHSPHMVNKKQEYFDMLTGHLPKKTAAPQQAAPQPQPQPSAQKTISGETT